MKKVLTVVLSVITVFSLCIAFTACGDKTQGKIESENFVAEGTFDKGVTLSASKLKTTDEEYSSVIEKIADKNHDEEKVAVYDISLVKDNAKVQPNGKVKITMPAPFESETGYVTYHISGERAEELATTVSGGKISFETASFSYFVVAGASINPNPNDNTKNFFAYVDPFDRATMTANGTDVPKGGYSAALKEGDTVELVARAKEGYQIVGWYKNEKASGSNERYDVMSNPAMFTYHGTEKMYVYARFEIIEYTITVNLGGGEFDDGDEIPETYNVESDTIILPTPQKGTAEFLGWTDENGNTVTEIAQGSMGDIALTAQWKTAVTKVNTIKNVAFAVDRRTWDEKEMVFENKNLKVGIGDIPFGSSSVHAFEVNNSSQTDEFSYALALGGTWNWESIIELVVAEKDRNVTVGRIHSFYIGGTVRLNSENWMCMHVEYEGKLESSNVAFDSGWFDLLPNVEGYTDAKGKWIYQGDPLDVYTDAKRVPKVRGETDVMGLEGYNGYQHGNGYSNVEFENPVDDKGVCKYDKYYVSYSIIKSKTEDRKYDLIVNGDVEIYIANKETCQIETLLISKKNEKHLVTITSPMDTNESWYTELLIIAKPGGNVILYNGISPRSAV